MCGTPPKLHAPDKDKKALCGQTLKDGTLAPGTSTLAFFEQYDTTSENAAGYTLKRCKRCERALKIAVPVTV